MRWILVFIALILVALAVVFLKPTDDGLEYAGDEVPETRNRPAAPAEPEGTVLRSEAEAASPVSHYSASGTVWEITILGERHPAADVQVVAYPPARLGEDAEPPVTVTTDSDGGFALEWPEGDRNSLSLRVTCEGDDLVEGDAVKLRFDSEHRSHSNIELVRKQRPELAGRALTPAGQPIEGVEIVYGTKASDGLTAHTGPDGRFALRAFQGDFKRVAHPTHRLVRMTNPEREEDGSWNDVELILAPTGTLRIQVVDGAGAPLAGLRTVADLSPREPLAEEKGGMGAGLRRRILGATTDERGEATLEPIWAELELAIEVEDPSLPGRSQSFEFHQDGLLNARGPGQPVKVAPQEPLRLTAVFDPGLTLYGTVRRWDGSTVEDPDVRMQWATPRPDGVFENPPANDADAFKNSKRFESYGYALHVPARFRERVVLLHALDQGRGFLRQTPPPTAALYRELDLSQFTQDEVRLDLVLPQTASISGTALWEESGEPFEGTIQAMLHDDTHRQAHQRIALRSSKTEDDGSFLIEGLVPGAHDLHASSREVGYTLKQHVGVFETGSRGVVVEVERAKTVSITVEVDAPEGLTSLSAVAARLTPNPSFLRPEIPSERDVFLDGVLGWPMGASMGLFSGGTSWTDRDGNHAAGYGGTKQAHYEFEPRQAGWYTIAVKALDAQRQPYQPIGLEPRYLDEGNYRFRFRLTPTVPREFVFPGAAPSWRVAFADHRGRLVPLVSGSNPLRECVGMAGERVVLPALPVGEWELRIGPVDELEAGGARHTQKVVIAPGPSDPILVDLP